MDDKFLQTLPELGIALDKGEDFKLLFGIEFVIDKGLNLVIDDRISFHFNRQGFTRSVYLKPPSAHKVSGNHNGTDGGSKEFIWRTQRRKEAFMLQWALTFLVLALIAGILGFGGVAAVSVEIAQILFLVFLVLFIIAAVMHAMRGRAPPA